MDPKQIQRREFRLEVRASDESNKPKKIVGYAARFNETYHNERIAPGAFTKTLREQEDIKAYWSHDGFGSKVLGRTKNGTLSLTQDDTGLYVEIEPNLDTDWGRSALASVSRGDVDQFSFGFLPVKVDRETIDGEDVDVLREVRLFEVSPVAEPWYPTTSAEARQRKQADEQPEPVKDHSTVICEAKIRQRQIEVEETELWMS